MIGFLLLCAFGLSPCPLIGQESVVWPVWDGTGYNPSSRCHAWISLTSFNPFHGSRQMMSVQPTKQLRYFWDEITLIWPPASSERESVVLSAPNGDCSHHWLEVSCDETSIIIMDWYMDPAARDDADRWIKWAFGRLLVANAVSTPSLQKKSQPVLSV